MHLYEERGPGFVEELRGMFAIALWDKLEQRLVLARDRFGIKPLYYRLEERTLSFASELKALLRQPACRASSTSTRSRPTSPSTRSRRRSRSSARRASCRPATC